ncbi:hypothetical protein PWT90_05749 [Aphanocladium album]|nr:hypothetical protein PWT90_05749 [Aphanocladium album]
MAVRSCALVLTFLASHASAASIPDDVRFGPLVVREQITVSPKWLASGSPEPNTDITLRIGLKQNKIDALEKKLMSISDPKSPAYGKWLSKAEVEAYTQPSEETTRLVRSWLASSSISDSSISQPLPDWLQVTVPLGQVESLLGSSYTTFRHVDTGKMTIRTSQYSVPLLLHEHIDTIQPTTAFHEDTPETHYMRPVQLKKQGAAQGVATSQPNCNPNYITGLCIRDYYNVDYSSTGKASIAVTGLLNISASHTDADVYMNYFQPASKGANFQDVSIAGAKNDPSNPDGEGNMDTQISVAIGHPSPVSYYMLGPLGPGTFNDQLLNLGLQLNSMDNPPSTVSTSYSGEEQGFSPDYLRRVCQEYMKAGARGVSLFFSSGDHGVSGRGQPDCAAHGFYTSFPSTCPYVTSVGGTMRDGEREVAADFGNGGSSGGGFSNVFRMPSYQSQLVNSYISSSLDPSLDGMFNKSGRAFPDVSLLSTNYIEVISNEFYLFSGTSVSTPAFAALVSLINDDRLSRQKPALGFLNPVLYGNDHVRAALRDITSGSNPGCNTTGFPTAAGWDPVTGLGSMDFAALRQALGSL